MNASVIFKHVPKELYHSYQYYNIPVSSDLQDPSNPLNILTKIAAVGDFVVLKLDIDNGKIEMELINQILNHEKYSELIDE